MMEWLPLNLSLYSLRFDSSEAISRLTLWFEIIRQQSKLQLHSCSFICKKLDETIHHLLEIKTKLVQVGFFAYDKQQTTFSVYPNVNIKIYFTWTNLTINNNIVPGIIMPSSRSRLHTVFLNTAYSRNCITSGHNNNNLL